MSKITLVNVASLEAENTAIATMAANNAALTTAINNTVSLDGTLPNTMSGNLDMGSKRIINLPTPGGANDPVRQVDLSNAMLGTYSGQIINGTANQITASTTGVTTTLSLPTAITATGITITNVTLATPAIGTPSAGVLTSCTGLPISTGVSGLGTGVGAFLATPSSTNLIAAITDETGTGSLVFANTPTLVTPVIGAATGTSLTATAGILSTGSAGVGYGVGAGGSVTQLTNRTTGVTLNKTSGRIVMFTAAGSATAATFTVTNSTVAATDTISLNVSNAGANLYNVFVSAITAGTFNITFYTTGGTASDGVVLNFNVIKGVVT